MRLIQTILIILGIVICNGGVLSWEFKDILKNHEPKINVEGAIERFLNAMREYYEAGGIEAVQRSMEINEGEIKVPRVRVFGMEEAQQAQSQGCNVFCFRIPAIGKKQFHEKFCLKNNEKTCSQIFM